GHAAAGLWRCPHAWCRPGAALRECSRRPGAAARTLRGADAVHHATTAQALAMKRFLPSLPLSLSVFVLWLLLVSDFSIGSVVLAALLAIALPLLATMLRPPRAHFGRLAVIVRLAGVVL